MLRDKFKDRKYFDDNIEEMKTLIKEDVEELEQGLIDKEFTSSVSGGNFGFSLSILYSMYSAGYDKNALKAYYPEAIKLFTSKFNEWEERFTPRISDYITHRILMMLSLGILLDAPKNQLNQVIDVIDIAPERYRILDYFFSYFDQSREINPTIQISEHAFKGFIALFDLSNEEITSKNLMGKYLETWYEYPERVHMHDTHNSGLDNYVGYWSFESAAFVKMRGLDDSAFRDNPYYPKDLL